MATSSQAVEQTGGQSSPSDPTPPPAPRSNPVSVQTRSESKRSRTKSSGAKRRKKKRETPPEGFDQWPEVDQKYYQDISALLRDSKATRKQCSVTRERIGAWKALKLRWANHPMHNIEMGAYRKALKEVKTVEKNENLDLNF